jgi:nitrite reductase (NADH) large subunit
MRRERLAVIGNGMASLRFLERLSQHAPGRFDVTVVGAEPSPAYNRVLLSSLLAQETDEGECRFRERPWYLRQGIRLITGAAATAVDLEEREVAVGDLTVLPFDRLVLATGSDPVRLPKPGMDLPGVVTFRDLADVAAIREAAARGARAVVIGGGLLGLEAAYGLARRGVKTTLVHVMDRLMERQLDLRAARLVKAAIEAKGVRVLLEADTAAVEGGTNAEAVRLADGRVLPADLVVVAVGVRPAADLARDAGLAVRRGILVDDALETSVPGVHAIGECAEHRGTTYGLVEPAYEQADILARRLGGDDARYGGSLLATSLKVSGVPVFSAGLVVDDDDAEPIIFSDAATGTYRKLMVGDGRLVGAVLVGDVAEAPWYCELIRSSEPVASFRHDLMFGRPPELADPARRLAA